MLQVFRPPAQSVKMNSKSIKKDQVLVNDLETVIIGHKRKDNSKEVIKKFENGSFLTFRKAEKIFQARPILNPRIQIQSRL